jgi:hypothetical protein
MNDEMRRTFAAENRCFFCRTLGHHSRECPELLEKHNKGRLQARSLVIEETEPMDLIELETEDQVFEEES